MTMKMSEHRQRQRYQLEAENKRIKAENKRLRERDKSGVSPEDWEQLNVLDSLRDENTHLLKLLKRAAAALDPDDYAHLVEDIEFKLGPTPSRGA